MSEINGKSPFIINSEEPKKYILRISKDNYLRSFKNVNMKFYEDNKDKEFIDLDVYWENIAEFENNNREQYYLSNHFKQLPYGLIDKSITGLGATTLEMNANRNSIIVTPTKNLAYSKWSKDKNNFLYVGSEIGEILETVSVDKIKDYASKKNIEFKKIFVVADSLWKVIDALRNLGINFQQDYFIMIDEVDKFMKDTSYREKLEMAIDFYFLFNKENRAMITATINDFSNPLIKNEVKTEFIFEQPLRDMKLIATNNATIACEVKIMEILVNNPDDKIFIALNSTGIPLKIISNLIILNPSLKERIGIACSDSRKNNEEIKPYYIDLNDINNKGILPKDICFTTSTNFVGIDIKDNYHLISVSTLQHKHHILTASDLIQIYGRNRKIDGTLSDTFIFESRDLKNNTYDENAEPELIGIQLTKNRELKQAKKVKRFIKKFMRLKSNQSNIKNDIKSLVQLIDIDKTYVRINKDNKILISYFSIDAFSENSYYLVNVYSKVQNVIEMLEISNFNFQSLELEIIYRPDYTPITEEQKADNKLIKEREIENCLHILQELENSPVVFLNINIYYRKKMKEYENSGNTYVSGLMYRIKELKNYTTYKDAVRVLKDELYSKGGDSR
ncbi:MAG: DEAD/DEAH box helicase family protein, partial [Bacteroidales bacterium]